MRLFGPPLVLALFAASAAGCAAISGISSFEKDDCADGCDGGVDDATTGKDGGGPADGARPDAATPSDGGAGDVDTADASDASAPIGDGGCGNLAQGCCAGSACNAPLVCRSDRTCGACPGTQTSCNGVCVDTNGDSNQCGACGHSCLGGACNGGVCQPVTLASGLTGPLGIAVDASFVYWTEPGAGRVAKAALDGSGGIVPLATGQTGITGVAVDGAGNVYWTLNVSGSGGGVMKLPAGSTTPAAIAPGQSLALWLVTDGQNVYFTEGGSNSTVNKVAVTGGTVTPLASGQAFPWGIAADATNVYWGTFQNNDGVWQAPIAGGGGTRIVGGQANAKSVAVDANNVYWVTDQAQGTVQKAKLGGSAATQLAGGQSHPYWLTVDGTYVYWTTNQVMRVPIAGGPSTVLANDNQAAQITNDAKAIYWASWGNNAIYKLAK